MAGPCASLAGMELRFRVLAGKQEARAQVWRIGTLLAANTAQGKTI
jgi:hypothetical protein